MTDEHRARILTQLVGTNPAELVPKRFCVASVELTGVSGAGIMLMSGDGSRGSVCASNPVSSLLEELQFALGEGPCIDASELDRPVLEPDLVAASRSGWVAFSGPAIDVGVRAVFGFPVRVGAARLGALNLHRDRPGPLTDEQHRDALVVAGIAAELILLLQANAPLGLLAKELEAGASFRTVVHQATGMVSAQLDVTLEEALVRLRSFAFGNNRPLANVARDVVERILSFGPSSDSGDGVEYPT